jgi:hypothetical protein
VRTGVRWWLTRDDEEDGGLVPHEERDERAQAARASHKPAERDPGRRRLVVEELVPLVQRERESSRCTTDQPWGSCSERQRIHDRTRQITLYHDTL